MNLDEKIKSAKIKRSFQFITHLSILQFYDRIAK